MSNFVNLPEGSVVLSKKDRADVIEVVSLQCIGCCKSAREAILSCKRLTILSKLQPKRMLVNTNCSCQYRREMYFGKGEKGNGIRSETVVEES